MTKLYKFTDDSDDLGASIFKVMKYETDIYKLWTGRECLESAKLAVFVRDLKEIEPLGFIVKGIRKASLAYILPHPPSSSLTKLRDTSNTTIIIVWLITKYCLTCRTTALKSQLYKLTDIIQLLPLHFRKICYRKQHLLFLPTLWPTQRVWLCRKIWNSIPICQRWI